MFQAGGGGDGSSGQDEEDQAEHCLLVDETWDVLDRVKWKATGRRLGKVNKQCLEHHFNSFPLNDDI